MLPFADFLFEHSVVPPGVRDWWSKSLISSPTTPLVVLPQQEHRTLIHAIAILHARGLFPVVTIDGGDNARLLNKVQALASALSVKGQIRFIANRAQAASMTPAASSSYQILAITPYDRDMPSILAEGMATGCALVGSSVSNSALAMIENGVNGHLVPPLNPQALATVLEKLLRDSRYTQSLGQAGKTKAAHVSSLTPATSH